MPGLQGKRVVVIGGSSGIDLATTRTVAEQGADVIVAARSEKKLQHVRETLPGNIQTYSLDVTLVQFVKEHNRSLHISASMC